MKIIILANLSWTENFLSFSYLNFHGISREMHSDSLQFIKTGSHVCEYTYTHCTLHVEEKDH
jgi:hypothetical protein